MNIRILTIGIATIMLGACATVPKPLQGQFQVLTPHEAAASDHIGATVRWGGRIIRTEPRADRTCFEVISTKLNADGRPYQASDDTAGRFIACRTGFYDPALFEPNREVTFTGRIDGYEERKVDEYAYKFPRVAADVVYLWPQRERVNVVTRPDPWMWGWSGRWGWGW
ncbi:Slp family lipoprotein [Thermomonas sp. HDW16]|uniref:Slp family lipoprotein n=1 Tax=Thermomonas sp. HDW16 TaxID=2714945 RepID=UPI00140D59FF|nr:Slp family lipoprotein [Thermomonas sp. HDW16]QIL21003.1 Slp/YeaY family lipoprotein [Thermomonas sp. HDW16]